MPACTPPPATFEPQLLESSVNVRELVCEIAHLLPSQGPISVFVHHNTLHAYEELPFAEAVLRAADDYGCHPYLKEEDYRRELRSGRISPLDLEWELHDTLGHEGDLLLGRLGTRHDLWMSMIEHPLHEGSEAEIRWFIEETDALYKIRPEVKAGTAAYSAARVKKWLQDSYLTGKEAGRPWEPLVERVLEGGFQRKKTASWSDEQWNSFALHLAWEACYSGSRNSSSVPKHTAEPERTGADDLVDALLIRFCAAFLDQGLAPASMPGRHNGFWEAFLLLFAEAKDPQPWLRELPRRLKQIRQARLSPEELIEQLLESWNVSPAEAPEVLQDVMLKLAGWAGMLWQMETNAEWTVFPAPPGTLLSYVAIRMLLLDLARSALAGETLNIAASSRQSKKATRLNRAFVAFQVAQIRGWSPVDLVKLSGAEWELLLKEIDAFDSRMRRRIYQQAYERHYRNAALNALVQNALRSTAHTKEHLPAYQMAFCIDDREESFRRHLEEIAPDCETIGIAGFFGVAMYYRGVNEAHFRPLCPVNVKPQHYVTEEPEYSVLSASGRRRRARQAFGHTAHRFVTGSRSFVGGLLAGVLGSAATVPLLLQVFFPRLAAQISRHMEAIVSEHQTQLRLEAGDEEDPSHRGYTLEEMVEIVGGFLSSTGMAKRMAPLVIVCGHGSSSLNNPHAAAYDCGACGGGRGGPNARAFAKMANDFRVREQLAQQGIIIPAETFFVGAYHNTCNDRVDYYDLDLLPARRRGLLERAMSDIEEAQRRDAHERCRRFESASLDLSPEEALHHVEGRAEDLSQVRSECGHATNALCLVGRRDWSRGLFLDRRVFLTSYDPQLDDVECSILARILAAVIPVCGGINLEYYFSRVDNRGYGCGTKLPHNLTSFLGVMDGAGSDLRTGLPWQMVEIHEPMRILFVIETTPAAMLKIMAGNPTIDLLVRNRWVQLATIDPDTGEIHWFHQGKFEYFAVSGERLPEVVNSCQWYHHHREHVGFAHICAADPARESER